MRCQWKDLRTGDIVKVSNNEPFSADLLLLYSSSDLNTCKIMTANIDGERNLNTKECVTTVCEQFRDGIPSMENVLLVCNMPDYRMHHFIGYIKWGNVDYSIEIKNLLWRGSVLKDTEYIIGMIVYSGSHSKVMRNKEITPLKFTRFDSMFNRVAIVAISLHSIVCGVLAAFMVIFTKENKCASYINDVYGDLSSGPDDLVFLWLQQYATFFVIADDVIPLAMLVSIEIIRVIVSLLLQEDIRLYDEDTDMRVKVQSMNLMEELGYIDYIITDKTGTLTSNNMTFHGFSIGKMKYIDDMDKIKENSENNFSSMIPLREIRFNKAISDSFNEDEQTELMDEFLTILTLCNDLSVDTNTITEQNEYHGSSMDEIALVEACRRYGVELVCRTPDTREISLYNKHLIYKILAVNEFTPERKRMSVLVAYGDRIKLYIKGADSVIIPLIDTHIEQPYLEYTQQSLQSFSNEGFRTLCVGYKSLDIDYSRTWLKRYTKASRSFNEKREHILSELVVELESGIFLLGATALRDELQVGVASAIQEFIQAGLKIWMITGDKAETAKNVAISCSLIQADYDIVEMVHIPHENLYQRIKSIQVTNATALIIDGDCFLLALEYPAELFELCRACKSVILARTPPKTKATAVEFIKKYDKKSTVLAIGDGANDVAMIQAAHVGVGLYGKEGHEAANSSDFPMGKFRILRDLLFVHGRWIHRRISFFFKFFYYKTLVGIVCQLTFSVFNGYSGQTLFESFDLFINSFTSGIATGCYGAFERDVNPRRHPEIEPQMPLLYKETKEQHLLSYRSIVYWVVYSLYSGGVVFLVLYNSYSKTSVSEDGRTENLVFFFITGYLVINLIHHVLLQLHMRSWGIEQPIFIWMTFLIYFPVWMYINSTRQSNAYYGGLSEVLGTPVCLFAMALILALVLLPYIGVNWYQKIFRPTLADQLIAQESNK